MPREPADVELVDDRAVEAARRACLARVRRLRHHGPKRRVPVVLRIGGPEPVPQRVGHGARARVEQFLARVEGVAGLAGVLRTVGAPGVAGARRQALHQHVPVEERAVVLGRKHDHLEGLGAVRRRIEQQLDPRGVAAEDAEVDAPGHDRGPRREARPGARGIRRDRFGLSQGRSSAARSSRYLRNTRGSTCRTRTCRPARC